MVNHAQIISVECKNNILFQRDIDVHLPVWLGKQPMPFLSAHCLKPKSMSIAIVDYVWLTHHHDL